MVRRFRGNDLAASTLNGAVDSSTTSWVLDDAASFPTEGDFYMKSGDEIVLGTHVSTNTITVVRAQLGTTAAGHADEAAVTSIITAEDIQGRINENGLTNCMSYGKIVDQDNVVLDAGDFTLINGTSSSTANSDDGIIELRCRNHGGDDLTGTTITYGTTQNREHIFHITSPAPDLFVSGGAYTSYGVWTRASTGGAMKGVALYPGLKIAAQERSTYLSGPSDIAEMGAIGRRDVYIRCTINWNVVASTDHLEFFISWDGVTWTSIHKWEFAFGGYAIGLWARNAGLAGKTFHILSMYEGDIA